MKKPTHSSVFQVNLVADDNEGKVLRVTRRSLDQKLIAPRIERFEGARGCDIVHENATIGAAVEGDAQRLETLLAGSIPDLNARVNGK